MEEPGEQYPVVFALIVTKPASECVPVTTHAKTTVLSAPDSSMLIAARKISMQHPPDVKINCILFCLAKLGHTSKHSYFICYIVEGPAGYSGTSVPYTLLILIVMEEPGETVYCLLCVNCYRTG
jgi:hypothetical protein